MQTNETTPSFYVVTFIFFQVLMFLFVTLPYMFITWTLPNMLFIRIIVVLGMFIWLWFLCDMVWFKKDQEE